MRRPGLGSAAGRSGLAHWQRARPGAGVNLAAPADWRVAAGGGVVPAVLEPAHPGARGSEPLSCLHSFRRLWHLDLLFRGAGRSLRCRSGWPKLTASVDGASALCPAQCPGCEGPGDGGEGRGGQSSSSHRSTPGVLGGSLQECPDPFLILSERLLFLFSPPIHL